MKTAARFAWCALQVIVCLAGSAQFVSAQSVNYLVFTPSVIVPGATTSVLVEAELGSAATSVTIDFSPAGTPPSEIALRDNGSNGDRVAGDRIYSGRLPAAPIIAARTLDDVNRVFVGFLNVFSDTTRTLRGNLFVDVYTSDMGVYPVTRLTQFVQATTRLVNIHDAAYFTARNPTTVTREFYRHFPDEYDVVNVVYEPQRFDNRTHGVIKNTVSGIGLPLTDSSASYGSGGRLIGISQFPLARYYDGAETGFIHELGHQWINHIRVAPFASGVPHWPYSSMANGVMGFSIGGAGGQGGTFNCVITEDPRGFVLTTRTGAPAFNDVDLYLMGLLPAGEVRDQFVFADQSTSPRCDGSVYTGAMTRVRIADVIAAAGGPRVPAHGQAPTTTRMATILVTRDGLASPEMMSFYSWMTERAEWRPRVPTHLGFTKELGQPFFAATGGRGTLQVDVNLRRPDFAVTPGGSASATVAPGTEARYEIGVFSRGATFTAPVTLTCESLPANATCSFESSSVTPGESGRTTVMSIATANVAAGTHVVIVTGRSGEDKHSTAVTVVIQ